MRTNTYTRTWFETFLRTYAAEQTRRELEFLRRCLPLPDYRRVLDVCCGTGRHALPLAERGYAVTGVDRDPTVVAEAQRLAHEQGVGGEGHASFVTGDMRNLTAVLGVFDAATCMWASFGYFDPATNRDVLRQMRDHLRPGGRLLLDVYHREFWAAIPSHEEHERSGRHILTDRTLAGDRLQVHIRYAADGEDVENVSDVEDVMEWQVFTPGELVALVRTLDLRPLVLCADFDERQPASSATPRMQIVCERGTGRG